MNTNGNSAHAWKWFAGLTFIVGLVIGALGTITATTHQFVSKEQYRVDQERVEHSLDTINTKIDWLIRHEAEANRERSQ